VAVDIFELVVMGITEEVTVVIIGVVGSGGVVFRPGVTGAGPGPKRNKRIATQTRITIATAARRTTSCRRFFASICCRYRSGMYEAPGSSLDLLIPSALSYLRYVSFLKELKITGMDPIVSDAYEGRLLPGMPLDPLKRHNSQKGRP
jgi:hypothetical protein